MKSYNSILKTLVLLVVLSTAACTEEFITKPIQPGTESEASFRKTADGIFYTLNASYAPLSGSWWIRYPEGRYRVATFRGDEAQVGGEGLGQNVPERAISDYNIFSTNSQFYEFWRICYVGVHYANAVIEYAPTALENATPSDAARINNYVAEAKVLRAYWYFDLVKNFGDVPLLLSATEQQLLPRTNRLLLYDQMQKDLTEAAAVLVTADKLAAADKGRMNNGTALALLAKVYIFRASLESENEYFTKAYQTAKAVIDSKQFALLSSYDAVWKISGNYSTENIIEGGTPAANANGDVGDFGKYFAPRYYFTSKVAGLNKKGGTAYGYGFLVPTQDFVNSFETGDPRKNWTILQQGDSANCGVLNKSTMQMICFDHSETGYYLKKYVPEGYPYGGNNHLNVKHYRYADLILLGAEAANEIGQTTDALAWLELVRARARNTAAAPNHSADKVAGAPIQITETNKNTLRTIIQRERKVELGLEDHRFYDLVRWDGKNGFDFKVQIQNAQAVVGPNYQISSDANISGKPRVSHVVTVEAKHKLLPIPDIEIKTSGNTLSQNEGY